ncbi:hypothetical protein K493DRAFT_391289 [Basidiobolus meristosporus CBS 931.73]|uniref:Uncharacterized protein n=1 Tax=Basidiobolus meristosporus CBS 931.73 TaxID=1314790 RepID=A0A1Y1YRG7_9FUNG|nr:hypothetical protein K493DRAFT_391289 [Basidiobolus meristosporus CBS 931.73]|eukprot:ORY00622.1 hypothetical protein K493DRAFT_391289 [Basidiobolus meristosporus CBS 931.73]
MDSAHYSIPLNPKIAAIMSLYSTFHPSDHVTTPLVHDDSSMRYSGSPPTIPPKVYTIRRLEYGPGTLEYELTLDYLRRSRSVEIFRRECNRQPSHPISPNLRHLPMCCVSLPPNPVDSAFTQHECTTTGEEEGDEKLDMLDVNEDTPAPPSLQQLRQCFRPDSLGQIDIESQQPIIPAGSLLFLFGFIFMPLWWLGSYYPNPSSLEIHLQWRCYNRMMSVVSIFLCCFVIAMLVWWLN